MSSFSEGAGLLRKARSALRRKFGKQTLEPVDDVALELLKFILLEGNDEAGVRRALRRIEDSFVDLNEVRVSFPREIAEVLPGISQVDRKAARITRMFNAIFLRHNSMNWDFFRSMGVRELRQYFEKVDGGDQVLGAAAVMLLSGGHAVPADADVRRVIDRLGLTDQDEEIPAVQAFLERVFRRNQGYEAWALLHRLGESACLVTTPQCGKCPLSAMCPTGRNRLARKKKAAASKKKGKKAAAGSVKKKATGRAAAKKKPAQAMPKKGRKTKKKSKKS